jgi:tetratricopeptide (TPR) repeat protein
MTAAPRMLDRMLLPRWRTWRDTLSLGELQPVPTSEHVPLSPPLRTVHDWVQSGGRNRAVELVADALVAGFMDLPEAIQAARELTDEPTAAPMQVMLAREYLGDPNAERKSDRLDAGAGERAPRRIATLRSIVRREPRNAVRWVDLGREYLVLGLAEQAEKCIRVALKLQPETRFVLRSAAHLFVHLGDTRAAQRALEQPVASTDPWLLSTRIALAEGGPGVRIARQMLADFDLPEWHAGELAGALATLDLSAGKDRSGRALLRRALRQPTENVLAHAVWVADRSGLADIRIVSGKGPQRQYEALARTFARDGRWADASAASRQWLADQPFSLDAATSATYNALEDEDFAIAATQANEGLRANRNDATLLNNRAFALANLGDIEAATDDLLRLSKLNVEPICRCCATATAGLVLFRTGDHDEGRRLYESAIDGLRRQRMPDLVARAAAYLAFEERTARTIQATSAIARARAALARTHDHGTWVTCTRLLGGSGGVQERLMTPPVPLALRNFRPT